MANPQVKLLPRLEFVDMAAVIQRDPAFAINPPITRRGNIEHTGLLINAEQNNVWKSFFQLRDPVFAERVVMG